MSKLCLVATKFENIAQGDVSYGFRMYDDYMTAYDNLMKAPELDDLKLLEYALNTYVKGSSSDGEICGALLYLKESENGIEINGEWYDWEQIKDLF